MYGKLILKKGLEESLVSTEPRIKECHVSFIMPNDNKHFWINSNLDFMPIACKEEGKLGEGVTRQLEGIKVMLNGVEDKSGATDIVGPLIFSNRTD